MAAITGNARTMRIKKAGGFDFPVGAGQKIVPGASVSLVAGYLKNDAGAAGEFWLGRATGDAHGQPVDNTTGADGAVTCHVDFLKERTFFPFIGNAAEFAQADVGGPAYGLDNQTVTKTATGHALKGTVWKIETNNGVQTVWVEV